MDEMQTILITDKALDELVSLFMCNIKDYDLYQILGFNISKKDPDYFPLHAIKFKEARL